MKNKKLSERARLGQQIRDTLNNLRKRHGWSMDDLSGYLEINTLTVRNCIFRGLWSDLVVTILKLKNAIPEELAHEYKRALEREKIEKRKESYE